jgi:hypothetical protein
MFMGSIEGGIGQFVRGHRHLRSEITRRAALCLGAPDTPPPGWMPAPQKI